MSKRHKKYWRAWLSNKQKEPAEPKIGVPPFWKLTISLADEHEEITVLPRLSEGTIHKFLCNWRHRNAAYKEG